MVRVAGLKRQIEKGVTETGPDGMSPIEQMRAIRASVIRLFRNAHDCWTRELVPALGERRHSHSELLRLRKNSVPLPTRIFRKPSFHATPLPFYPAVPAGYLEPEPEMCHLLRAGERRSAFRPGKYSRRRRSLSLTLPSRPGVAAKPRSKKVVCLAGATGHGQPRGTFPGMQIVEAHPFQCDPRCRKRNSGSGGRRTCWSRSGRCVATPFRRCGARRD